MSEGKYIEMMGIIGDLGRDQVWITKDGRVLEVLSMTDAHLLNTIRFLRRNVMHYQIADFKERDRYIQQAPDGASMACEAETVRLMDLSDDEYLGMRFPAFVTMLDVASRRGLKI